MNDEQLSQVLGRLAEKAVPDGSSIWDKLEAAYQADVKPKKMPLRLNWAAIFVAVLAISLLSTGGALAYYILLNRFPSDPGGQNVANAGLGQPLNLSQTVNGITINLVQGYADAERILLFYTLEGVDPTRFNRREPEAALTEIFNFGGVDNYQIIDTLHYQYRRDEGLVMLVSSFRHTGHGGENINFFWQLIVNNLGDVVPPEFHFNLSLPIVESLIIPVNQTIEHGGLNITLESIEMTAASSTVRICTELPEGYDHADFNELGLLIDGELYGYEYGTEVNSFEGQHYCMSQSFNAGILTGSETIEVVVSGIAIAPSPSQAELDAGLAELTEEGFSVEARLVDGHVEWEILSYPEGYNAEVWLYIHLYNYEQVEINHTFRVNLSEIMLGNR